MGTLLPGQLPIYNLFKPLPDMKKHQTLRRRNRVDSARPPSNKGLLPESAIPCDGTKVLVTNQLVLIQ
jgi:hypothetical protein